MSRRRTSQPYLPSRERLYVEAAILHFSITILMALPIYRRSRRAPNIVFVKSLFSFSPLFCLFLSFFIRPYSLFLYLLILFKVWVRAGTPIQHFFGPMCLINYELFLFEQVSGAWFPQEGSWLRVQRRQSSHTCVCFRESTRTLYLIRDVLVSYIQDWFPQESPWLQMLCWL